MFAQLMAALVQQKKLAKYAAQILPPAKVSGPGSNRGLAPTSGVILSLTSSTSTATASGVSSRNSTKAATLFSSTAAVGVAGSAVVLPTAGLAHTQATAPLVPMALTARDILRLMRKNTGDGDMTADSTGAPGAPVEIVTVGSLRPFLQSLMHLGRF